MLRPAILAEAAYLYDAVHLYAKALIHLLENNEDPRNGTAIIDSLKSTHYKSAMGYMVYIDENGDAGGNYTLIARKPFKEDCEVYGLFPIGVFSLDGTNSVVPVLDIKENIDWVTGQSPIAVPLCGFRDEHCISNTIEITSGVTGGILLAIAVVSLILYRNWKYEQELDSLLWKVDFREIQIKEPMTTRSSTESKNASFTHFYIRTSQVSLSSNPDIDFRYSTVFTEVGVYKGRVLAIKRVQKKGIDITREMKKELKMMRDLHHDNLSAFVGACTDPPNICILTEYCSKGSLKDILENEDFKLDSMFIASIVGDILKGMIYLHDSPVRFHGALHTGNCLVDSRWVIKLTDFGLREFKMGEANQIVSDPAKIIEKCRTLLYRSPELLRCSNIYVTDYYSCGSQKGDVYSFAMILYELHGRRGPFGDIGLSYAEILHRVMVGGYSPFRPPLEQIEMLDAVRDCLKDCWAENPDERPDFKNLPNRLRPLRKGMKPNIFDNMIAMLEKYANNLEALVDERTDQLQEEKKKTDALLYEMLPKPVAEQLKRGNKVEAEGFECVTIYFSDIVGFTAMSAESTPLEVVNFLNDLYTCFDSIIGNYDVYKVETIGDAYMVVSGLPLHNNQHAAEIATMSLHLLSKVKQFTIRHRPNEKLLLRIGIHSGPVCAGIVGLKMPRYCLFGDTVNTASRMESTGMPLKIHCSQQCANLLNSLGGYHLIERGVIPIKGKGNQQTYWLLSEDPAMRKIRKFAREARISNPTNNNIYLTTKSSLKQKLGIIKSPISRCSSFDSPKKLRFATLSDNHNNTNKTTLDVIIDSSPYKKSASSLMENSSRNPCKVTLKPFSSSCPCIENLATSTVMLAQSHISMFIKDDKNCHPEKLLYQSVPSLYTNNLCVPQTPFLEVISAPVSPKSTQTSRNKYSEYEEILQWADSTPLLKVTQVDDCHVLEM